MKFALIISSLVAAAFAQRIDTPENVLSCANRQITFSGGTPPYTILVVPGGASTSSPAIETFQGIQCSPFIWFVIEPANTPVFLRLIDSAGAAVTTAQFTIQPGGGNGTCTAPTSTAPGSCAPTATVSGGDSNPPPAGTTSGGGGGATTGGGGNTSGGSGNTSGGGGSTTGSPSPSGTPGVGFSNQVGIAGAIVGAVAMGLAALA